ncbi:MAG: HAD family phosphatase [Candidatus Omnitrophota bacterium]
MITTIIFDLSEVYLRGLWGTHEYLSKRLNLTITPEHLYNETAHQLFLGNITEEAYWKIILEKHGWNIDIPELKEAVRNNFREIEGVRPIIEKLRKNGYKLGLLSVHAKEWVDHLESKFDYHKLFNSTLYSFEVAIIKPDKKAYKLILEKLAAKPNECLFIDDGQKNISAASELGIKTILFESPEKLLNSLKEISIRV